MIRFRKIRLRKEKLVSAAVTLVAAGSLALLAGCSGMGQSPLAPVQKADVTTTVSQGASQAVSSAPAAAKPVKKSAVTDTTATDTTSTGTLTTSPKTGVGQVTPQGGYSLGGDDNLPPAPEVPGPNGP